MEDETDDGGHLSTQKGIYPLDAPWLSANETFFVAVGYLMGREAESKRDDVSCGSVLPQQGWVGVHGRVPRL